MWYNVSWSDETNCKRYVWWGEEKQQNTLSRTYYSTMNLLRVSQLVWVKVQESAMMRHHWGDWEGVKPNHDSLVVPGLEPPTTHSLNHLPYHCPCFRADFLRPGLMNSYKYQSILVQNLQASVWLVSWRIKGISPCSISLTQSMHDKSTQEWLKMRMISVFEWPSQRPDLKPSDPKRSGAVHRPLQSDMFLQERVGKSQCAVLMEQNACEHLWNFLDFSLKCFYFIFISSWKKSSKVTWYIDFIFFLHQEPAIWSV